MGHYDVLGVTPDSSVDEIHRAYLIAARLNHPDRHGHTEGARAVAEEEMRKVNEAWMVLRDPDLRSAYDRVRFTGASSPPRTAGPGEAPTNPGAVWTPYDTSPDTEPAFDERDDRPITSSSLPGWLRMAPAVTALAGLFLLGFGSLLGLPALIALGVMSFVACGVLFIVAPLVAMTTSAREDRGA